MNNQSDELKELARGLTAAQAKFGPLKRDKLARISSRTSGKTYEYRYCDLADTLEAIRGPLADNGLCLLQRYDVCEGRAVLLITTLLHSSGQFIESSLPIFFEGNDPRTCGSFMSYMRRYAISALVGIAPEMDDDGGHAGEGNGGHKTRASKREAADMIDRYKKAPSIKAMNGVDKLVDARQWTEEQLAEFARISWDSIHQLVARLAPTMSPDNLAKLAKWINERNVRMPASAEITEGIVAALAAREDALGCDDIPA